MTKRKPKDRNTDTCKQVDRFCHYGNWLCEKKWYMLIMTENRKEFSILWEWKGTPPTRLWWNHAENEWLSMDKIIPNSGKELL